jgi:hypothetical protein
MQVTGRMHGPPRLRHVDFPIADVLGVDATEEDDRRTSRRSAPHVL